MPVVPKLREVTPQGLPTPYQTGRGASVDAFGGGVAEGLGSLAGQLGESADRAAQITLAQKMEDDKRRAKELQTKYRAALSGLWFGTDTEPGFGSLRGENAIAAHADYRKRVGQIKSKLLLGAPASIKDSLASNFGLIEIEELDAANRHVQRERTAAEQTVSEAALNESLDAALRDINNPATIEREERRGHAEIRTFGASQGLPADVIQSRQEEFSTALHSAVIDNLIETDLPRANAYFEAHLDRIDGRMHAKIRRQLDRANEATATEAFQRAGDNETFIATFGRLPANYHADQAALDALPGKRAQRVAAQHRQLGHVIGDLQEFSLMPLSEQAELLKDLRKAASSPEDTLKYTALAKAYSETAKAIQNDTALELYSQRGEIDLKPIDWKVEASKQQREATVARLSQQLGVRIPYLTKPEVAVLADAIDNAPSAQVAATFSTIAKGFGQDAYDSVVQQMAIDRPALAAALSIAPDNVERAAEIVRGDRLAKENPDMRPTPTEMESAVEDSGLIAALALSPEALAPYKAAATARFIERRATGNEDYTIEDAINEVTGVIEFNGRPILPPRVGMTGDEFEEMVASLSPADFKRLGNGVPIFADGTPFTADQFDRGLFLTDAELHSVGPGLYQIFIDGLGYIQAEGQQAAYQIDLRHYVPSPTAAEPEPSAIEAEGKAIARREREALDRARQISDQLAAEAEAGRKRLDRARAAAEKSRRGRGSLTVPGGGA